MSSFVAAVNGSSFIETPNALNGTLARISNGETLGLHIVSLVFSAISLSVSATALYLFLTSRRSFRHDLVLLLIISDFTKSLWLFLFPLISLISGPIASASLLCQISGFCLSFGLEAFDIAVLLIAAHAFLSILHPVATGGSSNGIYPYRFYAYAIFVCFPMISASLAFLNKPLGYVNTGEYCYIASHPIWPSLFLSWIPRLFTFVTIVVLYVFLYNHVRDVMQNYEKTSYSHNHAKLAQLSQVSRLDVYQLDALQPLPPIAYHGVIPHSRSSSFADSSYPRHDSNATLVSDLQSTETSSTPLLPQSTPNTTPMRSSQAIRWKMPDFSGSMDNDSSTSKNTYRMRLYSDPEPVAPELLISSPSDEDQEAPPKPNHSGLPGTGPVRPGISPLPSANPSFDGPTRGSSFTSAITSAFRNARGSCSSSSTAATAAAAETPSFTLRNDLEMARTRSRVIHQLRLMFIYPIAYIGIWVFPFACSMMRIHSYHTSSSIAETGVGSESAPYALVIASMVSLCIQGTVDSGMLLAREKPWREKLQRGTDWWWGSRSRNGSQYTVGRTREEMLLDSKVARQRRVYEINERKAAAAEAIAAQKTQPAKGERGVRNWWDVHDEGDDDEQEAAAMSFLDMGHGDMGKGGG
ncbi:G protein-coupled receptor GPR1 [Ceratocystis fimbriata CBS 114723]|uniref:G protein-coupled receptor GPR1 n=1 Tax=Ceratocystis fimbriata CBS 114723 TaxID=1035309 RepID=A0A2C5WYE8_9PEZI|nr:G protein-coupled receptor GPR1 [Ceratocystis fimbriata CBS 114723]